VRRANTRPPVLDWLVADAKLPQIEPHHLRLDLDLVELLAAVDANYGADHLGDDDHVAQVRLDKVGLLVGLCRLFRFAELLDQTHRLALEAPVEAAPGAGVDDVAELFGGEVEESVLKGDGEISFEGSWYWREGMGGIGGRRRASNLSGDWKEEL
jgi:hypothetical protein